MAVQRHVAAPRLETERLILRPHRVDDFERLCALWSEPAVFRFTIGRASTRGEIWHRLMRYAGYWSLLGFGFWAVEEKATGAFIGDIGVADFHREIEPSLAGMPEFGWILTTAAHDKGYGTEVLERIVPWAVENLSAEKFCCIISPENVASMQLAQKFGFRVVAETTYEGGPTVVLERRRVT